MEDGISGIMQRLKHIVSDGSPLVLGCMSCAIFLSRSHSSSGMSSKKPFDSSMASSWDEDDGPELAIIMPEETTTHSLESKGSHLPPHLENTITDNAPMTHRTAMGNRLILHLPTMLW